MTGRDRRGFNNGIYITLAQRMAAAPSLYTHCCSEFGTTIAVGVFPCVEPNMVSGFTGLVICLNLRRLT